MGSSLQPIYGHALRMIEKVGTEPCQPSTVKSQHHHSNIQVAAVFDHYTINIATPFLTWMRNSNVCLQNIISDTTASQLGVVPSVVCTHHVGLTEVVGMYKHDFLSPELFDNASHACG